VTFAMTREPSRSAMLRRTMRSRQAAVVAMALGTAGFIACGARTGLPFDEALQATADDSGMPDAQLPSDADASDEDALPPLDATRRDASRMDCLDAGDTQIYLVGADTNELLAFYPPQGTFKRIGVIACPTQPSIPAKRPFSMAVDRKGVAYVLFDDLHIYRVSTATAACVATPFRVSQLGFNTFGMGFSTNMAGPSETLFVAADDNNMARNSRLGSIDTTTFNLTSVGPFRPSIARAELTGTGDGRLFAFYTQSFGANDSFVGEIDKATAAVIAADRLSVNQGMGYAFAFWGGDFYLFTGQTTTSSNVTRFRPSDKSTTVLGAYPALIVGAGVSTCAPQ
jgi:hypothetical protein